VLAAVRPVLIDLQAGLCFYCGDRLGDTRIEVDHFIPWSRYAADLGHNLILADIKCNNRKRDRIPAVEHLARWTATPATAAKSRARFATSCPSISVVPSAWRTGPTRRRRRRGGLRGCGAR
jgi:5-methylcytosine-specific restriction endonuclease McrA